MKRRLNYFILVGLCALIGFSTGCKSPKKVETVDVTETKSHTDFFNSMIERELKFNTLSTRMNVDLSLPGKEFSSRVDMKMIRDSVFQLSVQPILGIEMIRLEMTKDSIKVVDRINKRYMADNYEQMRSDSPIAFNFYNLQALFTDRIFIPGQQSIEPRQYNRFKLVQTGSQAEFSIKDAMDILYSFLADGEEKLLSTYITDANNRYTLQWLYSDFRLLDKQPFPFVMDVKILTGGAAKGGLKLNYSRIQLNEALKMDFPIPAKYKKVTFADIMKSITK